MDINQNPAWQNTEKKNSSWWQQPPKQFQNLGKVGEMVDEDSISQPKIYAGAQPATSCSGCLHLGVWFHLPVK